MTTATELQAFLYRAVTTNACVEQMSGEGMVANAGHVIGDSIGPSALDDFSFEARLQARRMGRFYELLHCLENSVRELVESTLSEKLGPEEWWAEGGRSRSVKVRTSADRKTSRHDGTVHVVSR